MSEINLGTISKVENSMGSGVVSQLSDETPMEKNVSQRPVEGNELEKPAQGNPLGYLLKDVELKFVPDNGTKKVTVFVVDKTSRSVLRTIPPEEMEKLNVGDLLEITA